MLQFPSYFINSSEMGVEGIYFDENLEPFEVLIDKDTKPAGINANTGINAGGVLDDDSDDDSDFFDDCPDECEADDCGACKDSRALDKGVGGGIDEEYKEELRKECYGIDILDCLESVEGRFYVFVKCEQYSPLRRYGGGKEFLKSDQLIILPHGGCPVHLFELCGIDSWHDGDYYSARTARESANSFRIKSNKIDIPGSIDRSEKAIKIYLSQKGRRSMGDAETMLRVYQSQYQDAEGNQDEIRSFLNHKFFAKYIYPYAKDMGKTPFEWAFLRTKIAISVLLDTREGLLNTPMWALEEVFKRVAKQVFDKVPENLKTVKKFPAAKKRTRLLDEMKDEGIDPRPETAYFFLSLQDRLSKKAWLSEDAKRMNEKMQTWVGNGFNAKYAIEMYKNLEKWGIRGKKALTSTVEIIDNIYGSSKENPWYFIRDFSVFGVYIENRGKFQGKRRDAKITRKELDVIEKLSKVAGCDFVYACETYLRNGSKLEEFMPQEQAIEITCLITKGFGIENAARASRIIDIMLCALKDLNGDQRKQFIELFVNHVKRNSMGRSPIIAKMQGDEVTIRLPEFDTMLGSVTGNMDFAKEEQLDDGTFTPETLKKLVAMVAIPFEARAQMGMRLLKDALAKSRMLECGRTAALALPRGEGSELAVQQGRSSDLAVVGKTVGGFLLNALQFYESSGGFTHRRGGFRYMLMATCGLRNPFSPPPRLLEILELIERLPQEPIDLGEVFDNFHPLYDNFHSAMRRHQAKRPSKEAVRTTVFRFIMEAYETGMMSSEQLEKLFAYLAGDVISPDDLSIGESEGEYIWRRFDEWNDVMRRRRSEDKVHGNDDNYYDNPDRPKKVDLMLQEFKGEYRRNAEEKRIGIIDNRFDKFMQALQTFSHLRDLIVIMHFEDLFDYKQLYAALFEELFASPDGKNANIEKGGFLDPYQIPQTVYDRWDYFAKTIDGMVKEGLISVEALRIQIEDAPTIEEKMKILEGFYETAIITRKSIYAAAEVDFEESYEAALLEKDVSEALEDAKRLIGHLRRCDFVGAALLLKIANVSPKIKALVQIAALGRMKEVVNRFCVDGKAGAVSQEFRNAMDSLKTVLQFFGACVVKEKSARDGVVDALEADIKSIATTAGTEAKALPSGTDVQHKPVEIIMEEGAGDDMRRVIEKTKIAVEGVAASLDTLISNIERTVEEGVSDAKNALEKERTRNKGKLPVGAKIHLRHTVNQQLFEQLRAILQIKSTAFKLEDSLQSIIIPPVMTDEELCVVLKSLDELGLVDHEKPEVQVTTPGEINNHLSGIWATSRLLYTEVGKPYGPQDFVVNQPEATENRMVVYDYGHATIDLPYMTNDIGIKFPGRTDLLGIRSINDIKYIQAVKTVLTHVQYGGIFKELGLWFMDEYEKILKRHDMKDVLDVKWVNGVSLEEKPEHMDKAEWESIVNHYKAVGRCTKAWDDWFDKGCGEGIVKDVRDLTDELMGKMEVIQKDIVDNGTLLQLGM